MKAVIDIDEGLYARISDSGADLNEDDFYALITDIRHGTVIAEGDAPTIAEALEKDTKSIGR